MKKQMRKGIALATMLIAMNVVVANAVDITANKWVKGITLGGDLRLRQENFDNSGTTADRQRQRLRIRLKTDFILENSIAVRTRLSTSEPASSGSAAGADQVSTNQTLTNNGSKKPIWLDMAYVEWKPKDSMLFQGGKMQNPFWMPTSADVMWDTDYTQEGLSEGWAGLVGPMNVFVTLGQFGIEERNSGAKVLRDAYLFSEQAGVEFKLPLESRFKTALAHHEFANISSGTVGGVNTLSGNTANQRFSLLEWTNSLSFWIASIPVAVQATLIQNNAAKPVTIGGVSAKRDKAQHVGLIIGKANPKRFELAYFYKEIDQDAVVSGITDSDMPNLVNTKGHIGWIGYGINEFVSAQVKYFDGKKKDIAAGAATGEIKRAQFDLSVKF